MSKTADIVIEEATIRAGALHCQCRLYYPDQEAPLGAIVFAPPHPFLGGNFDNNVVLHLAEKAASAGFVVLTYNLPGVGRTPARPGSENDREAFWSDPAVGADAELDAMDFIELRENLARMTGIPPDIIHAVGYSHGAAVALLAGVRERFGSLTLISAPLPRLAPGDLARATSRATYIFGGDDLALEGKAVGDFLSARADSVGILEIGGADHFYIDHLDELADAALMFIQDDS